MKEESKKVGSLVNRYGLLAVLGLGYSFIGTSMYAAAPAAPAFPTDFNLQEINQDARLIANSPEGPNAWIFNSDGVLSAPGTVENIFCEGQPDTIKFIGTPTVGNLVQVIFNGTQEPGDGFVIDDINDRIPEDVLNSLKKHDDPATEDAKSTIDHALVGLFTVTDRGAAKKQVNAIVAALDVAKTSNAGNPPANTTVADFDALKGILEDIRIGHADEGIQADAAARENVQAAWDNLVAAAAAAGAAGRAIQNNDGGIANIAAGQAGGGALAALVNAAAAAGVTDASLHAAIAAISAALTNDSPADSVKNALDAADALDALTGEVGNMIQTVNAAGGGDEQVKTLEDAKQTIVNAKAKFLEVWGKLAENGVRENDIIGTVTKGDLEKLIAEGTDVFAKVLAKLESDGLVGAPYIIAPVAASAGVPSRTFVLQITQEGLKNDLDLLNVNGSGNSIVIDAQNMRENEMVCVVFNALTEAGNQETHMGKIFYNKLQKDSELVLINNTKSNVRVGSPTAMDFKDLYEHLTLKTATKNKEFSIEMLFDAYVRKLVLGLPAETKIKIANGNLVKELQLNDFPGKCSMAGGSLYTREGIQVLSSNSGIEFLESEDSDDWGYCFLGGDVTIPEGVKLTMNPKSFSPVGLDRVTPELNGTGSGKVGIFSVKGTLGFETSDISFKIVNKDNISYHNYIALEGGIPGKPSEIKLNGITLKLEDEDSEGKRILNKINTQDSSQLILVKENSYAKITGGTGNGNIGGLKLSLHGDNAKNVALIRLEKGAIITLDPLVVDAEGGTAIDAGPDGTFRFLDTDTVTFVGNVRGDKNTKFVFVLSDPEGEKAESMLVWEKGKLLCPTGEKVGLTFEMEGLNPMEIGLKKVKVILEAYKAAHPQIKFIDFSGNAEKDVISAALSDKITGPIQGIELKRDTDGNLTLDFSNMSAPSDLRGLLGGSFDTSYLSDGFYKFLNNVVENGYQTQIEKSIMMEYVVSDLSDLEKKQILAAFCKTTTEEKNRVTLTFINSARETAYSKMGQEFFGDKCYNVWASGFGDVTRNGSASSYKMKCNIYGFTTGIDWRIGNNLLVGALGGYGKAKAKYKGDMQIHTTANKGNKCDFESYFGGIYGMWDEFIKDICVKFSLMAGHGKYKEQYELPRLDDSASSIQDHSPKGHWISGNIDCTYKHWNLYGLNIGPWVSLSATTVHQKSHTVPLSNDYPAPLDGEAVSSRFYRNVDAADRRSIEATIGIAADYDFSAGILELAMGYKHEFRNLRDGKVSLYQAYSNDNYKGSTVANEAGPAEFFKFDASNVNTGKDSFVAKAAWNMKFGDFGLSLGGHGQFGNHFRDIAGSITASYSF